MAQSRNTAYKVWINDIVNNSLIKGEGEWGSSYIIVDGVKISRVNLIVNVVAKNKSEDGNFVSLTLDDGSDTIRIKSWSDDVKLLEKIGIGNIVNLIGRIREYNNEIYLTCEICNVVNPNWELVRKLELLNQRGKPKKLDREFKEEIEEIKVNGGVVQEISSEGRRRKILNIVEKLSDEEGVDMNKVINESKLNEEEAQKIIFDLIKEGEIFQPKNNKLKLIE